MSRLYAIDLFVMVWVGYIKASAEAHNVPLTPHILRSLSFAKSNGTLVRDEDLCASPTTPLEGNRARVRRVCSTKPIFLVRVRGKRRGQTLTQTLDARFWDAICSMDITSAEGFLNISTIVHSPSKIAMARSLKGDKAQSFIEQIDRVSDFLQIRVKPHRSLGC
jgi:hypothetical protein